MMHDVVRHHISCLWGKESWGCNRSEIPPSEPACKSQQTIFRNYTRHGSILGIILSILLYCDGVTLSFECLEPRMKGDKKGRIYLTTHRMIFRANNDSKGLMSFSFPFYTLHNLGLEQPVFGANYIKGMVKAEANGGWTGSANFRLTFKTGGAIEYGQALMAAGQAASRYMGQQPPPPYSAPTTAYVNAQNYMAPSGPAPYGFFVPTNVFPERPPANQVFMYEQPPPYPGVMGVGYMAPNGTAYATPPAYSQQPMQYPQQPMQYPQQPMQYPQQPMQYPQQNMQYPQQNGQYPQQQYAQQMPPANQSAQPGYPAAAHGDFNMGPPPAYAPAENKKMN